MTNGEPWSARRNGGRKGSQAPLPASDGRSTGKGLQAVGFLWLAVLSMASFSDGPRQSKSPSNQAISCKRKTAPFGLSYYQAEDSCFYGLSTGCTSGSIRMLDLPGSGLVNTAIA